MLLNIGWCNALGAVVLAVAAALTGRLCRRPALTHGLWLLVLLKLVTPPLLSLAIPWPAFNESKAAETASNSVPVEEIKLNTPPAAIPLAQAQQEPALSLVPSQGQATSGTELETD